MGGTYISLFSDYITERQYNRRPRVPRLTIVNSFLVVALLFRRRLSVYNSVFKGSTSWAAPRENQHYGICVKYRPGSATQAYLDRHCSSTVEFLFQESLLYTSILQRRNVSARISMRGLRRLIWIDTLHRGHTVGFLEGQLCFYKQRYTY